MGEVTASAGTVRVTAADGLAVAALDDVPQDIRITLMVKPQKGAKHFGLCVRGQGDYKSGCELQFAPERAHVQLAPVAGRIAAVEGNWMAIPGVAGIGEPFVLDVIVKDDLVDACIGDRRTIIARNRAKLTGDRLFFFADHGDVTFEDIQVRPLKED